MSGSIPPPEDDAGAAGGDPEVGTVEPQAAATGPESVRISQASLADCSLVETDADDSLRLRSDDAPGVGAAISVRGEASPEAGETADTARLAAARAASMRAARDEIARRMRPVPGQGTMPPRRALVSILPGAVAGLLVVSIIALVLAQLGKEPVPENVGPALAAPGRNGAASEPIDALRAALRPHATFKVAPPSVRPVMVRPVGEATRASGVRPHAAAIAAGTGNLGWVDVDSAPGSGARLRQLLAGEGVQVHDVSGDWALVSGATDDEKWEGWVRTSGLTRGAPRVRRAYAGPRSWCVSVAPGVQVEGGPLLPFGAAFPRDPSSPSAALLPDGRRVPVDVQNWTSASRGLPLQVAIERAGSLRSTAFEIGGNSPAVMDGSGLVRVVFAVAGVPVPRGAEAQARAGVAVDPATARPGDVAFFSGFDGRAPRPVILLSGDAFLEASPRQGIGVAPLERMRQHELLALRRYAVVAEPPNAAR